jgi:ribosomal protein S18 acetylase RimI-like enzyme
MGKFTIRAYEPVDADRVLDLIIEFQEYLAQIDARQYYTPFSNREDAVKYLEQSVKDVEEREGAFYIAEIEGDIVGFTQGIIDRHKDDPLYVLGHKSGDLGWIGELFVKPVHRGQGIANKLVEAMTEYFKSRGCINIRLKVASDNKLAQQVYEKMGFKPRCHELMKEI